MTGSDDRSTDRAAHGGWVSAFRESLTVDHSWCHVWRVYHSLHDQDHFSRFQILLLSQGEGMGRVEFEKKTIISERTKSFLLGEDLITRGSVGQIYVVHLSFCFEKTLYRTFHRCFLPNFGSFGYLV